MICDTCDTEFVCVDNRKRSICDKCVAFLVRKEIGPTKNRKDIREDYNNYVEILWSKMLKNRCFSQLSKVTDTYCWVMANRTNQYDYQGVLHNYKSYKVHLVSLVNKLGRPIKKGYEGDHLCLVKGCFNPDHLEEVTKSENAIRGGGVRHGVYSPGQGARMDKKIKKGIFKPPALGFEYGRVLKKKLP